MENKHHKELKKLIDDSSLAQNLKMLWDLFLKMAEGEECEAVYEAASESRENLELLTEHLRDKIWDMKENNQEVWTSLVREEGKYAEIL